MSVLIRGFKMPKNCDVCPFSDWSNLHQTSACKLKNYEPGFPAFSRDYLTKRSKICPMIDCSDYPDGEKE